jgi:aromatic ring-cleaving dioxygenase
MSAEFTAAERLRRGVRSRADLRLGRTCDQESGRKKYGHFEVHFERGQEKPLMTVMAVTITVAESDHKKSKLPTKIPVFGLICRHG